MARGGELKNEGREEGEALGSEAALHYRVRSEGVRE
jgi:hypothetical protein